MQIVSKRLFMDDGLRLKWIVFIVFYVEFCIFFVVCWSRNYKDIVKLIVCNDMEIIVSFFLHLLCRIYLFSSFTSHSEPLSRSHNSRVGRMKMQISVFLSHERREIFGVQKKTHGRMTFLTNLNITHCEGCCRLRRHRHRRCCRARVPQAILSVISLSFSLSLLCFCLSCKAISTLSQTQLDDKNLHLLMYDIQNISIFRPLNLLSSPQP